MDDEFPVEVLDAIKANRKIEAIKLLREATVLDLKEAKEAVDNYMAANPDLKPGENRGAKQDSSLGRFILFALFVAAVIGVYQYLNG